MNFLLYVGKFRAPAWLRIKMFRIMKLTAVFIFSALLQVSANSYSQRVTVEFNDATLKQVFKVLQKETGYSFIWDEELVNNSPRVTVKLRNASFEEAMQACLKGHAITYQLRGKLVVINPAGPVLSPLDESSLLGNNMLFQVITGKVEDPEGRPIVGASLIIKGTGKGTVTNENGEFSLEVMEKNATLVISCLGYLTREIRLATETTLSVILQKRDEKLEEVVVSTGIFTRKQESYTGAVTVVTAKELQQFGNRNLITSLRNIDPAFNIVQSIEFGNNPNRLPEIQIRGNSSLPNVDQLRDDARVGINTPLVILDGFESTLQKLLDINENEVESLTLLKDASATAIYGSRGANGVIVIQTKAPTPGKLRVSYRGDLNLEMPDLTGYDLLEARQKLELENEAGLYSRNRAADDVPLKRYYNFILDEVNRGVNTDWLAKPLRAGVGQRHNIRLEGGDQAFRYSVSAQVNDIQGVMKSSFRRTLNGTINLTYNYGKFRFTNSLLIGFGKTSESPYGSFADYVKMNPYWTPTDENGNVTRLVGSQGAGNLDYTYYWLNGLPVNPLYNATLNTFNRTDHTDITNNFSIDWRITQDLNLRGRIGITRLNGETDIFKPADHTDFERYTDADFFRRGTYAYGTNKSNRMDGSLNLSYNKQIGDYHSIFSGVDVNIRENQSRQYDILAEGFTNSKFDFFSMALQYARNTTPSGSESLTRNIGLTGSVNYTFDQRYFADLSVRSDGSSQFGKMNRFAPFWSAGLGWNLHKERLFKQHSWIDRLKLRGSTGTSGTQNFSSYQSLSTYRYYTSDRYYNWLGASIIGLGNEDLKWQQKLNYNVGLEANFLNNRFSFVADYYIETTRGMISSIDLPSSNGYSTYIENIGKVENRGFEFKATAFIIRDLPRKFSWNVSVAMVHNKNRIVEISEALEKAQKSIESESGANPSTLYKEGHSINAIWVVPSLGIDPSTGKEMYLNNDNEPTYTWSSLYLRDCGISEPKYFGNINTMVRYKALSLNVSLGYRAGGQAYNQTLIDKVENADYKYNVDARVYEQRWRQPGDITAFKALQITAPTNKTSRFVQNEKTLSCQNINLQYEIKSPGLIKKLGLQALNLGANMADAFYISSIHRERGLSYPFSRQFSFTINALFQ